MKAKILSLLAISALMLTACSNDDTVTPNEPQAVQFGASINKAAVPQTLAANDTWSNGDAIGIFMVDTGATTIVKGATNKKYTTTGSSSFTPVAGEEIYYPSDATKVDFIAYYPHLASQALGNYSVDVASQTSLPDIDLLWSKADNAGSGFSKTSGNVPLVFNHKLSKVIINTTATNGLTASDLLGMTVTIEGMNTQAPFDLSTGVLGAYSAVANITPATVTDGVKYEAIVLPADFAVDALAITFTIGTDVFTWKNPTVADGKFEAGKQYTYDMVINPTGVTFTCTINPWDTTTNRTGTAN